MVTMRPSLPAVSIPVGSGSGMSRMEQYRASQVLMEDFGGYFHSGVSDWVCFWHRRRSPWRILLRSTIYLFSCDICVWYLIVLLCAVVVVAFLPVCVHVLAQSIDKACNSGWLGIISLAP
ncbi:unnamed protein product [Mycena citricolor]|uniref:Uncharacterized protein n=1 Tax=Mycena citricolor TaxID=2018698 RepID=A0AAD2JWV3_9AGAR|nr:unnamed protein product [Mycena citricolor]